MLAAWRPARVFPGARASHAWYSPVVPRAAARFSIAILALVVACADRERATVEELRVAIERYRQAGTDTDQARIKSLFARLDTDIAALRTETAAAERAARAPLSLRLTTLESERMVLLKAWTEARVARAGAATHNPLRGVGDAVGRGLEGAGRKIRDAARGR